MNVLSFIKEVKAEALRVVWPSRKEVLMSLGLVFVMVLLSGLFFLLVDSLFFKMIKFILG
ncbi:MAG: preprotein translocase subunit SecE [Candidatus Jidaibacter sp.]|nr:preprotein translocase subunit SecE [Candidatus Jidaibacter sp.]